MQRNLGLQVLCYAFRHSLGLATSSAESLDVRAETSFTADTVHLIFEVMEILALDLRIIKTQLIDV
jgi:hypothetical protein